MSWWLAEGQPARSRAAVSASLLPAILDCLATNLQRELFALDQVAPLDRRFAADQNCEAVLAIERELAAELLFALRVEDSHGVALDDQRHVAGSDPAALELV